MENVALKILKARCSDQHESRIYNQLADETDCHPGRSNVLSLKDHFHITGPNGIHSCLVYEAMGPSVSHMTWDRVSREVFVAGQSKRFTLSAARTMLYHLLLGLDFIHSKGLAHGDIHAGNLLFSLRDISKMSVEELRQSQDMVSAQVERLDGSNDPSAPRFLTLDQPLREWVATGSDLRIKISDLGSGKKAMFYAKSYTNNSTAFFSDLPPADPKTPIDVRSPELLLQKRTSSKQDIWAFGCLIYTLLTNRPLFELTGFGGREYIDDEHIIQMVALLGPLPEYLKNAWPRFRKYFDENGTQTVFEVDWPLSIGSSDDNMTESSYPEENDMALPEGNVDEDSCYGERRRAIMEEVPSQQLYPSLVEVYKDQTPAISISGPAEDTNVDTGPMQPPLRDRWQDNKHPEITPDEAEAIASLLQQIFRYDPAERPTTTELLRHPWVEDFCANRAGCDAPVK